MISKLHYITQDIPGRTHQQLAEEACIAGVDWVQLRVKNRSFDEWLMIAEETVEICRKFNVRIIINDNPEIAKLSGADGVHLGREDISPAEARKILGETVIIGGTANTVEDINRLVNQKVNYIGLGPYRFTSTKEKLSPVLGGEGIRKILATTNLKTPVVIIGGITSNDVEEISLAGAYGVAVSSAINLAENKQQAVEEFLKKLK